MFLKLSPGKLIQQLRVTESKLHIGNMLEGSVWSNESVKDTFYGCDTTLRHFLMCPFFPQEGIAKNNVRDVTLTLLEEKSAQYLLILLLDSGRCSVSNLIGTGHEMNIPK